MPNYAVYSETTGEILRTGQCTGDPRVRTLEPGAALYVGLVDQNTQEIDPASRRLRPKAVIVDLEREARQFSERIASRRAELAAIADGTTPLEEAVRTLARQMLGVDNG